MAGLTTGVNTQADAQARLQLWLDAEEAIAGGQAYSIGDRTLTRADLAQVTERIGYWQRQVQAFQAKAAGASGRGYSVAHWRGQ